jgi:hypothetical protein
MSGTPRTSAHNLKLSNVIRDAKNAFKRTGHVHSAVYKATEDGPPKQYYEVVNALDEVAKKRYDATVEELQEQKRAKDIDMVFSEAEHTAARAEQGIGISL